MNFPASNCCTSSLLFSAHRVEFLTDLGFSPEGKLPLMVLVLLLSHSLSHTAVIGLGSTLKILLLKHLSCSTFTVPHCSAAGFRLSMSRWPLRFLPLTPHNDQRTNTGLIQCCQVYKANGYVQLRAKSEMWWGAFLNLVI